MLCTPHPRLTARRIHMILCTVYSANTCRRRRTTHTHRARATHSRNTHCTLHTALARTVGASCGWCGGCTASPLGTAADLCPGPPVGAAGRRRGGCGGRNGLEQGVAAEGQRAQHGPVRATGGGRREYAPAAAAERRSATANTVTAFIAAVCAEKQRRGRRRPRLHYISTD